MKEERNIRAKGNIQKQAEDKVLRKYSLPPSQQLIETETEGETGDLFEGIFGELQDLEEKKKKDTPATVFRTPRGELLSTTGIWLAFIEEAKRKHPEKAALISEGDFRAFVNAIRITVFNQSRLYKNIKTNAGIKVIEYDEKGNGETKILPNIIVSLNGLCMDGFGVTKSDSKMREKFRTLIELLKDTPIRFENDYYVFESYLCTVQYRLSGKTRNNNPETYWLNLNNIFCANIQSYGTIRQDHTILLRQNVKQITPLNWRLLDLLAIQDKRTPFTRYMESRDEGRDHIAGLFEILGIEEKRYRKDRRRAEREVIAAIEAEIKTGLLQSYETVLDAKGRNIEKIIFHFNPEYAKAKRQKEEPEEQ